MRTYDPKQVLAIVGLPIPVPNLPGSFQVTGFSEDSQIEVDFDEDTFQLQMGTDGEGTRVKTNNFAAKFKLTLMQSSDSNDKLGALWLADRANNAGIFTFSLKDLSGRSIYFASQTFITKVPASGFHKKAGPREWVLQTDNCVATPGGN